MKKLIFPLAVMPLFCSFYSSGSELTALEYCATVDAWPAQIVLSKIEHENKKLDTLRAKSTLFSQTPIVDNGKPVVLGEWGKLYNQVTKLFIPYKSGDKHKELLVVSVISAVECSLSQPAVVDLELLSQPYVTPQGK